MAFGFLLALIKTFLSICFVLGSIALVHEFGHYITAKLTGIWVIEFAIGFGNRLIKYKHGETIYSVRPFPLGGFVRLAGMDQPEEEEPSSPEDQEKVTEPAEPVDPDDMIPELAPDDPRGYPGKPRWAKVLVLGAGSAMNMFWAVALFIFIYLFSGGPLTNIAVLDVTKGQPAAEAGVKSGDLISGINGVALQEWTDGIKTIQVNAGKEIILDVVRNHPIARPGFGGGVLQDDQATNPGGYVMTRRETLQVKVVPTGSDGSGRIGISLAPNTYDFQALSVGRAITKGFESTGAIIMQTVMGLARMISRETSADVAGPVKIMQMIKEQAHKGLVDLLYLTALLSVNIGLINMFPFPVLDGGRIVFVLLEAVFAFINMLTGLKLEITSKVEEKVHFVGMLFLLGLLVMVTYQDIRSFF